MAVVALPPGLVNIPAEAVAASAAIAAGTRPITRIRYEVTKQIRHTPPDPTQDPLLHLEVMKYRINDLVLLLLRDRDALIRERVVAQPMSPAKKGGGSESAAKREITQARQMLKAKKAVDEERSSYEHGIEGHLREIGTQVSRYRLGSANPYIDAATTFALTAIQDAFNELSVAAKEAGVQLPQIRIKVPLTPDYPHFIKVQ